MDKISVKKVLEVIQESLLASDEMIDKNNVSNDDQDDSGDIDLVSDIDTDTQAITALAIEFAQVLNERDFQNLDGRAEYYLYTVDHLIELVKNNDEQNIVNLFKENKIKSQYIDCEFISITFSDDDEQAEVVYNVTTSVVSASDNYFKNINKKRKKKNLISAGTPFSTEYTLVVKKEKGTWKIDKFKTSE